MTAKPAAVAWCRFQPRTAALATALGGQAYFLNPRLPLGLGALPPARYAANAIGTWRLLNRVRAPVVVAVSPPVFAPLVAWLWCRVHQSRLVIDCHTSAFAPPRWGWTRPLHRWLASRSSVAAMTFHTEDGLRQVADWRARALLLPDDVPAAAGAEPADRIGRPRVVVAGSLDDREPVEEALAAADLLPDVNWRFTGETSTLQRRLRTRPPGNVTFTGWLPYTSFLDELARADVVAAFSTDPGIMNRAAFEAIGLEQPLVLSDLPGLRSRFGDAAVFCANDPSAMATAVTEALRRRASLRLASRRLRQELQQAHVEGLVRLEAAIARG